MRGRAVRNRSDNACRGVREPKEGTAAVCLPVSHRALSLSPKYSVLAKTKQPGLPIKAAFPSQSMSSWVVPQYVNAAVYQCERPNGSASEAADTGFGIENNEHTGSKRDNPFPCNDKMVLLRSNAASGRDRVKILHEQSENWPDMYSSGFIASERRTSQFSRQLFFTPGMTLVPLRTISTKLQTNTHITP